MASVDLELVQLQDIIDELSKRFDTVVIAFKGKRTEQTELTPETHNEDIIIVGDYHDAIAMSYRAMAFADRHLDTTHKDDKEKP